MNLNSQLALVTISLPSPSYTVIVLSQLDSRYFTGLSGQSEWMFDFVLFEKGGTEVIAESLHARFYSRSVNLEVALPEGDYVVHVRLDRQLDIHASTPSGLWSGRFFLMVFPLLGHYEGYRFPGLEQAKAVPSSHGTSQKPIYRFQFQSRRTSSVLTDPA